MISPQAQTSGATLSPDTRVGDIVAARPLAAQFFQRLGIDYCCGGKRTLAAACAARGLDAGTVVVMLETTLQSYDARPTVDAAGMSLTALADHVEQTHHAYLKQDLPILVEQAARVAIKHGDREPELRAVAEIVREFAEEMFDHMAKEERILFPIIRALDQKGGAAPAPSLANPIRQMEAEHVNAGDALVRLRELTHAFSPPADACNTHRALFAGLAQLETDLHQHVHKENNILFPRALAREANRAVASA